MVRLAVVFLLACALSAPAHALDVRVFAGGISTAAGPHPSVDGPVVTGDGTIVLGLATSATHFNIVAFSPGLDSRRTLASFGDVPKGWDGRDITLAGTPRGVVITDDVLSFAPRCCVIDFLRASVRLVPTSGPPGRLVEDCPAPCGHSAYWRTGPLYHVASDGERVFSVDQLDGVLHATVHDSFSGAETPVALDDLYDEPASGIFGPQIAGSYLTYPPTGQVINWQTGEVIRRMPETGAHALLADGTLIYGAYENQEDHVWRWALGDAEPIRYDPPAQFLAVAQDHLLVKTATGLEVWALDGSVISHLAPLPSGTFAFDGSRVISVQASCLTVRIETIGPGQAAAAPLDKLCATPVPVKGTLTRHAAIVTVHCPMRYAQGCVGQVRLLKPVPPGTSSPSVAIRAGATTTVRLAHWKSTTVCAATRRVKRWYFSVGTPAGLYKSQTPFNVGRIARCGNSG